MSTAEKLKALKAAQYRYERKPASNGGYYHRWYSPDGELVVSFIRKADAVSAAFYHLEASRTQAASDAAGEAEYGDVMAEEIHAVENFPADAITLLQKEIATLQAENARLVAGMNELVRMLHRDAKITPVLALRAERNAIADVLEKLLPESAPAAPVTAEEVTLKPKYKVNDLVQLLDSDWPRRIVKVYVSQAQGKIEYLLEDIGNRWYQEGDLIEFRTFDAHSAGA